MTRWRTQSSERVEKSASAAGGAIDPNDKTFRAAIEELYVRQLTSTSEEELRNHIIEENMRTSTQTKRPAQTTSLASGVASYQPPDSPSRTQLHESPTPDSGPDVDMRTLPISPPDSAVSSRNSQPPLALQRQALHGVMENRAQAGEETGTRLRQQIQAARGGGEPLPHAMREPLEQHFHTNLSSVRLHTDAQAHDMARTVQATAFTTGPDIFFRRGSYQPGSASARRLLTEEVAHSIQQAQGPVDGTPIGAGVTVSDPEDRFERAAQHAHLSSSPANTQEQSSIQASAPASSTLPIQRNFYWKGGKGKNAAVDLDADDGKSNGLSVFVTSGGISANFLKYAKTKIEEATGLKQLKTNQIKSIVADALEDGKEYILGAKPKEVNLVEPLTKWLIERYKNMAKEGAEIQTTLFAEGEKRTQYHPKPAKGEETDEPGRLSATGLGDRTYSFAEGITRHPQFVEGGYGSTQYTLTNDNGTYSIGAYQGEGESLHLLGGSVSGEKFGEAEGGMHAEEQQFEALRDQIERNSRGIADKLKKGTVIMHLHISKSPCSEKCQGLIRDLLTDYKSLQIQMYLEIPYMANEKKAMIKEAQSLDGLLNEKEIQGRLAYQVVSVLRAKTELAKKGGPLTRFGSKTDVLFADIGGKDKNPELADKRSQLFEMLVAEGYLSAASYVDALNEAADEAPKPKKAGKKKIVGKSGSKKRLTRSSESEGEGEKEVVVKKAVPKAVAAKKKLVASKGKGGKKSKDAESSDESESSSEESIKKTTKRVLTRSGSSSDASEEEDLPPKKKGPAKKKGKKDEK